MLTTLWDEPGPPGADGDPGAPYETEAEACRAIETDPVTFPPGWLYRVERYCAVVNHGPKQICYRVLVYDKTGRFIGYASNRRNEG